MTKPITHRRRGRRSWAVRLDPYAVDEMTITLEEWRRRQEPAARTRRGVPVASPRKHAA